jgi:hypothetical protein
LTSIEEYEVDAVGLAAGAGLAGLGATIEEDSGVAGAVLVGATEVGGGPGRGGGVVGLVG